MPNIRKSFHFREGVQVDDEVLVVRGSRVGIGTTVPDEALDVRGDAKVTGIATVNNIFSSGISTLTELRIGTGVTVSSSSGIVSATKFVGDGSLLTSLPTSAWTSYGSTGIYNHSNVGVGTAFPTRDLQIGADPYAQSTLSGIGIGSDGNIKASGIVTASSFVGDITGDLTGEVNAGSLDTNANGVVVTGDLSVSGVSTLGVSTFTGDVSFGSTVSFNDNSRAIFGDDQKLHLYYDGTSASIIKSSGQMNLAIASGELLIGNTVGAAGVVYKKDDFVEIRHNNSERLKTTENGVKITGITTSTGRVDVSVGGTAFTALPTGRVGVGTAIPGVDLQIKKPVSSTLELISDTGTSTISIGNSVGAGNSSAQIKFGNGSLEFFNKDLGSVNMYLHSGSAGVGTGRFDWLYGQGNDELMCLTHEKKLGIGVTNPSNNLHVVGTSTITSHSYVGGNLHVDGTIYGTINWPTIINSIQINNTSGLSTFHNVTIGNVGNISSIGINNNTPRVSIDAFSGHIMGGKLGIGTAHIKEETSLTVQGLTFFNHIGIGTTAEVSGSGSGTLPSEGLQVHDTTIGIKSCITRIEASSTITTDETTLVGIGTTLPRAAVDFASAGDSTALANGRYMLPPKITTTQRNALSSVVAGAIIYNINDNKLQCYNGSSWNNLF